MKKEKYIYERKTKKGSPYFQIQISFRNEYGEQKTFYKNISIEEYPNRSTALKRAIAERDKALNEIHSNKILISSPTVSQLIQKQKELIVCSVRTQERYTLYYSNIPNYLLDKELKSITTADIQKNLNEYSLNHSNNCIKRLLIAWRRLYTTCNLLGYEINDKTLTVVIPKSKTPQPTKTVIVSNDDYNKVLSIFKNYSSTSKSATHRARMIWYLIQIMAQTGCRPAEILALSEDDITPTHIYIRKAVGSNNVDMLSIIPTKTKQSERTIPISSELYSLLKQLQNETMTTPLLTERDGSLMDINKISQLINLTCKKNGIHFNLYMLRHTVATNLIANNTSPRTVQDILGHASFTMSVEYARSTEEEKKKALEKIKNE